MTNDTELWHSLRADNVGGSECPDLFNEGFNSHFHLWHVKAGNIDPVDLSGNERVMAGNFLEAGIRDWANWKWGNKFQDPKAYYRHETIKGMACTPDGIDEHDPDHMCQIKNVDSMWFGRRWESEGDTITNAPLSYLMQVQWELACANKKSSDLIVLVGGNTLKKMPIFRDDEFISMLESAAIQFWRSIEVNDPPEPEDKIEGPVIQELRSKQIIEENKDPVDWSGDNRMNEVAFNHFDANVREKEAKADKSAAAAEIVAEAGNHKRFITREHKITIVDKGKTSYPLVTEL